MPPTFVGEIQSPILTAGVGTTWYLPEIIEGDAALAEVLVEPDTLLT